MFERGQRKIHLIGIGGYGMSAIASILIDKGYDVTGSDLNKSKLVESLLDKGAKVFIGHKSEQVELADVVIYSTAIPDSNPELIEAKNRKLPLYHRSEVLAMILNSGQGIAVAGAHGKTSTTSMISFLLEKGDKDPTALIGGELGEFKGNARLGESGIVVAEACESDHSFLRYRPEIAVITNIEADHLEHYDGDFSKLLSTYKDFLNNLASDGKAIIFGDDQYIREVTSGTEKKLITYGLAEENDYYPQNIEYKDKGSFFDLYHRGKKLGKIELSVPGLHNILNAISSAVVALEVGVNFSIISKVFKGFGGAKRRFQIIHRDRNYFIVDDYAHHPTEIKATLQAAKEINHRRLVAIFQPQRYSRTYYFYDEFASSFENADEVIIADIYTAGEEPIQGVSSEGLAEKINRTGTNAKYIGTNADIINELRTKIKPGDLVITMGAGDIWKVSHEIGSMLKEKKVV
ncbi:UDP-N-acetylmuramate--L-alanine ligase [Proteinivorax tanatarense]|uniref:UDP-N-acetylmuramate--L-alanine ligase n=1 Tax=Proteinivorax tanatarense TaxID=1260629 RepID=A0AAU7VKH5_9FIRM